MTAQAKRRRLACSCIDWSEQRPHLGGALGAAWLQLLLKLEWAEGELDSRALCITRPYKAQMERLLSKSRPS